MSEQGLRYGPLLAALGAAALGLAVFQPWYGLTITQAGIESAEHALNGVAQQYGNTQLQGIAGSISARFGALAGNQLATISAHDALKDISVVLLIAAAVGLIAALLDLAGAATGNGVIALAGVVALVATAYRMLEPPVPAEGAVTLSLQWGAWLALAGAGAMVAGALWPARHATVTRIDFSGPLESPSDWTPQA